MKILELYPRYDPRKSFYGKAQVIEYDDGDADLLSYNTLVSECRGGAVKHLGRWSQTTSRHQKEFERQYAKTVNQ